jgi:hypothetical protein
MSYHLKLIMASCLWCSVLCCLLAVSCNSAKTSTSKTAQTPNLTVDEVLRWKATHGGDLLGKDKDAVIARYGAPDPTSTETEMEYTAKASKALNRSTTFAVDGSKVSLIKVFVKEGDFLNVEEVIKKATLFTFETGTFTDTTMNYFSATTKDGRNVIQFVISDSGVSLRAVMFEYKP